MRGFQCLLLCTLLYSASVDAFGTCKDATDSASCPDNAVCKEIATGKFECVCEKGFDEVDVPGLTKDGKAVTVCVDLGVCSPFDNVKTDCGKGQCVIYQNDYGLYVAACKCDEGFYGINCDKPIPPTTIPTTAASTSTTKKPGPGPLIPIIGGGALLLVLLAGGAAALASSSG